MPASQPTIREVAANAGVSVGTVSNVLNGRGNVSAGRADRVRVAMRELGFVPNRAAQSLRTSASRVIGLCTPLTSSAYFMALLETLEAEASQHGYEIMQVLSHNDPAIELRRVQALVGRNVDGLILIPTHDAHATLELLADRRTPTVVVDQVMRDARFNYVAIDDRKAMREAIRQVIQLGHRRLLYIVRDATLAIVQRRIEGFMQASRGARLASARWLQRDPDDAAFRTQIDDALAAPERPTALIASNSAVALSLVRILQDLGVRWPDDVALLAFDEPVWARIVTPPLAVVRHPTREVAKLAWKSLLGRLEYPAAQSRRIILDAHLVAGPSLAATPRARPRSKMASRLP